MAGPFTTPVAQSVPLENKDAKDNDFKALNVQDGMEEIDFRRETREPTGFIIPVVNADMDSTATISFVNGTRTFTITPISGSYEYLIKGCRITVSGPLSIVLPDTSGTHIIYLNELGALSSYVNAGADKPYDGDEMKVGVVYWNAIQAAAQWRGDPRSELSMTWGTQRRTHFIAGTEHGAGTFMPGDFILNGDGNSDTHAQLSFTGGNIFHEDARWTIIDSATPTNDWEQELSVQAQIPILYREGTGNGVWRKIPATDFPLAWDAGNLAFWNENNGGTWQLTNAANNKFVAVSIFATIDPDEPVIGILHDVEGGSPLQAVNYQLNVNPPGLPFPAFSFIKVLIFQTSDDFTNQPKARLVTISDGILADTVDRYAILAYYGGQANNGRVLEITPEQDSEDEPLLVPEDSFIRTVTVQSTQNIDSGKRVGWYNVDTATLIFEVTIPSGGQQEWQFDIAEFIAKGTRVSVEVTNGAIQKPSVRFWVETIP